jgi:hypothetical protein
MLITRKSILTGKVRTLDIPVTQEQLDLWEDQYKLIQDVMPHLTPGQREFILTGATDEEWDTTFAEDKE